MSNSLWLFAKLKKLGYDCSVEPYTLNVYKYLSEGFGNFEHVFRSQWEKRLIDDSINILYRKKYNEVYAELKGKKSALECEKSAYKVADDYQKFLLKEFK